MDRGTSTDEGVRRGTCQMDRGTSTDEGVRRETCQTDEGVRRVSLSRMATDWLPGGSNQPAVTEAAEEMIQVELCHQIQYCCYVT